jgi:hypothetical protein
MDTTNYLDFLFTNDPAVIAANVAELARIAQVEADDKAANAARLAETARLKVANRCPKCMGAGRLPQFAHRKGGECFTCGGSGVFAAYRA